MNISGRGCRPIKKCENVISLIQSLFVFDLDFSVVPHSLEYVALKLRLRQANRFHAVHEEKFNSSQSESASYLPFILCCWFSFTLNLNY